MRRNRYVAFLVVTATPLVLLLTLASAQAGDESIRKQVLALNQLTGREPLAGKLQALLDDQKTAKLYLSEARKLLKEPKQPFNYNSALLLATIAEDVKDVPATEEFLRVCITKAFELRSTAKLAQSYGNLIEMLYNNKKYAESAKACRELLELKVKDTKPRLILIPDESDDDFIVLERYDLTGFLRQGVLRLLVKAVTKQGQYDQAMKVVENLLAEEKNDWMDVQLKGWVQREAGKEEESAKTYERVLELIAKDKTLEPDEKDHYILRNRYLLSGLYVDIKRVDKAAEQLKILMEKRPKEAAYPNDLGYIWADHDMNLDESEKLVRKALDLDRQRRKETPNLKPEDDHDNGSYLDSLGWVFFKQKRFKEAVDMLRKAVEDKESQHLEIYDHLGDAYLMLGQKAEAVAAWKKGLEFVGETRRDQDRRAIVEKKIRMNEKDD
jgi:tetratricopeptide (TPR) repeat protein